MPHRALKPCLDCRKLGHTPRCTRCTQAREAARGTRQQRGYTNEWLRASKQAIAHHLEQHGWTCPGWNRPPHPVHPSQLTGDHHIPLAAGGPPVPDVITVMCRSCNSSKGKQTN